MSNLVEHARRELTRIGEDPHVVNATVEMIRIFSECGHSGTSAYFHMDMLARLLRFENLGPLTDDSSEWNEVGHGLWQSSRRSDAFSEDGGATYYLLSERSKRQWPLRPLTFKRPTHIAEVSR